MALKKFLNGELVDMTANEETSFKEGQAAAQAAIDAITTENNEKKANQVSGNQKLLDLGLTQAEATALTGYKPD
tara:strand:+ start:252 stop:473 length:222 start_codon:yes stop_codon:yes gene_type:complete